MSSSEDLQGFTSEAASYLLGIAADNSKAYFEANRELYSRAVRQPLEDLLCVAESMYGPGKIMRPNRDVRFSANKDPYRTDASMWAGNVGGVYLNLNPERLEAGGGLYEPARDQLDRARTAIAENPKVADDLKAIFDELIAKGFTVAGPSLKTAPRGMDPIHPAIELLRLQHYAALRQLPLEAKPERILETWKALVPLIEWVETYVGPSTIQRSH
ncbi:TIGR02453 family protein [Aurantimicrobium minutum]|uniref:DUF2461 domain-containing protein n=1 Tax=Aurantimicrobium minutum TaxID=708131 RepID=A0A173LYQ9_9MICO|nr:DUF2461 domain-containing protein [Aurantimicrobium minutum]BAU99989.1 Uncharacterized protein AUMI_114470 [Aurantimicrobium minutum]